MRNDNSKDQWPLACIDGNYFQDEIRSHLYVQIPSRHCSGLPVGGIAGLRQGSCHLSQLARSNLVNQNASPAIKQEKRPRLHCLPEPWTEGSESGDEARSSR